MINLNTLIVLVALLESFQLECLQKPSPYERLQSGIDSSNVVKPSLIARHAVNAPFCVKFCVNSPRKDNMDACRSRVSPIANSIHCKPNKLFRTSLTLNCTIKGLCRIGSHFLGVFRAPKHKVYHLSLGIFIITTLR